MKEPGQTPFFRKAYWKGSDRHSRRICQPTANLCSGGHQLIPVRLARKKRRVENG